MGIDTQLHHQAEDVHDDPALGYLAVGEPVDGPRGYRDVLTGRGYAEKRALMRAVPDGSGPDLVAVGELFRDRPLRVRERRDPDRQPLP